MITKAADNTEPIPRTQWGIWKSAEIRFHLYEISETGLGEIRGSDERPLDSLSLSMTLEESPTRRIDKGGLGHSTARYDALALAGGLGKRNP